MWLSPSKMSLEDITTLSSAVLHDEDDTTEDDESSAILVAKSVTMVCLCLVSICIGLIPIQVARWFKWTSNEISPRSAKIIDLLLGFGGGVLLSTTFLHILPEVAEGVEELVEEGSLPSLSVSLAELLMCSGFFLMYLVEELVHVYLGRDDKRRKRLSENSKTIKDVNKSTNELVMENGVSTSPQPHPGYGHGHSHIPLPAEDDDDFVVSSLRGLLVVLGLSVHELFEGLAIGLSSTASDVWYLFGAVAAHKFVIAFCIGVELVTARTRFPLMIIYICTYAVVSPIGVGIAMIVTGGASAAASGPVAVILQGLATGTLLYVVFFEILRKQRHGIIQYLSVLIGFLLMVTIQFSSSHSHEHGHGHSHGHSHEEETKNGDDDHLQNHDHRHHPDDLIASTISNVTEKILDVISTTLSSTMVTEKSA
ncbi:zinc transporter ZIP1-like isoform X2 [Neodiprion fabricii]|uniref:zinc transporter ZIP1-like isoform X2 n=2 Tax=Neodiprion fabricii TaxID=2872261 RepID=UPI001ED8E766|nr:zinc transporter ZIP1-like isoform X2 [Neodiprion fabricii]